jgi:putative intracellular protease/amidase
LVPCIAQNGTDQGTALATLNGQICTSLGGGPVDLTVINRGNGAGVFSPGCYSSGGAMSIGAGTVNLNGAGVYVFKSGGTLTTADNSAVTVTGGACEADVFWAPGAATTLGATTSFKGSILDGVGNAITVGTTTNIVGRLLSFGGVVTTNTDTIAVPSCTTTYPAPVPTLSEWAMITFAMLIVGFGVYQQRRRKL